MDRIWKIFFSAAALASASISATARTSGSIKYLDPYSIEQLGPGWPVNPNSKEYKEYHCRESAQYEQSVYCIRSRPAGGKSNVVAILHLYNNIVTYINKTVAPAEFTKQNVELEINRLSAHFGQTPNILSSTEGLIATWGAIELRPLSRKDLMALAQGGNPKLGFLVGFLPNPHDSARAGLPVYSLGGGKGYVWIASIGKSGRKSTLRFLAADPSRMDLKIMSSSEDFPEPRPEPTPTSPRPPQAPQAQSAELPAARDRLEGEGRAMTWVDEKYLSPEQLERYRFLKNAIEKMSSSVNSKRINDLAANVEDFIKEADATIEKEKQFQACQKLKDKLTSEASSALPPAILQKRDDAILRASTLNKSSKLSEIIAVQTALEDVQSAIADINALAELRRSAKLKIEQIAKETDLILDEEIQKALQQRILDAKKALQSDNLSDAQQSVSELLNYYAAHSEGNRFEPN
jgi:hypothetical protein